MREKYQVILTVVKRKVVINWLWFVQWSLGP